MDNRQTEMALLPPRVEDQELSPRTEPGQGLDIGEFASSSFNSAVERFRSAGNIDVNPEDPELYNAYRRSIDYLGDMALGGLDLSDAAFRAAVGIVSQALPEDQERRFARDLAGMPEAFMGFSPARIAQATDEVVEGVAQVGRNLTRRDEMPVLGSNLGNVGVRSEEPARPSGRVTNPLLSPRQTFTTENEVDRIPLLDFYSPLRSAVEQMPIAREGSTGETIMAYLNKRAPNVSSSEINFSSLNLDPNTRYTREEVLSLLERDTSNFRANMLSGDSTRYRKAQRQIIDDPELSYIEITLDSPDLQSPASHFFQDTFAHSRSSIRRDVDGEYVLIEELQSDPLQRLNKPALNDDILEMEREGLFDGLMGEIEYSGLSISEDIIEAALGSIYTPHSSLRDLKNYYRQNFGLDVQGADIISVNLDAIRKSTPDNLSDQIEDNIRAYLEEAIQFGPEAARIVSETDLPFTSNTQYVRDLILSNIAVAKNIGSSRVVIPPIEEIARLRAGTGDFPDMESAARALRPTYVDAVRKAVNILNNEANGTIRVGTQALEYPTAVAGERTRRATGTLLDISDFEFDPQTQAARFAEGGAVTMDKQMSLFEEGGLMDDGAERDPVSGNKVPAGSMSEEVRDDVPVMLSEGEYVVPADVVRYFGLNFFENLRNKAKDGLQGMEEDGRIGGEPVDSTPGDEDITEEERMMLMEVMGMAQGGMVTQQQMQQYNPYAMQQQQYSNPQGYQVGGMVTNPYSSPYMPNAFPATSYATPGSSVFGTPLPTTSPTAPTGGSQTTVTLYSPQGVPFELRLPRDQQRYNDLLALGYTTEMPQQVTVGTPVQPGVDTGGDDGVDLEQQERERAERAERTRQALTQDPIQFGLDAISGDGGAAMRGSRFGAMLGPVGAVLGGIAGTAITAGNVANARAASTFAQQQGYDTTELDSKIDEFVENLSGPAKMISKNITGQRRFDNWMNDIWDSGGLGIDDFAPGPEGDAAYKAYTESPDTRQEFIQREELDRGDDSGPGMTAAPERDFFDTGVDLLPPTSGTPSISQETIDRASGDSGGGTSGGGGFDSASGGYSGPEPGDTSNVGSWFGDRDGDGVGNWRDFNDGVGANDKNTDGGGSSEGSGKIVCTAMNASYGFGSYRQAIWLKYSETNLTEYHEKGYHKIFLPLVDRAYNRGENNSKTIKAVLENIARHRTADLRAEMQGKKRDKLGRVYRTILEPICYVVGRFFK